MTVSSHRDGKIRQISAATPQLQAGNMLESCCRSGQSEVVFPAAQNGEYIGRTVATVGLAAAGSGRHIRLATAQKGVVFKLVTQRGGQGGLVFCTQGLGLAQPGLKRGVEIGRAAW